MLICDRLKETRLDSSCWRKVELQMLCWKPEIFSKLQHKLLSMSSSQLNKSISLISSGFMSVWYCSTGATFCGFPVFSSILWTTQQRFQQQVTLVAKQFSQKLSAIPKPLPTLCCRVVSFLPCAFTVVNKMQNCRAFCFSAAKLLPQYLARTAHNPEGLVGRNSCKPRGSEPL